MTYNISTADIEARWRALTDAEADVATTLIGDATALLDTYRSGLSAAVTAGTVSERIVVMAISEAVIRVLANPDIWSNQSVSADGGISLGWQFARTTPVPRMRLSDIDLSAIDRALSAAGVRTGRTASMIMHASTQWRYLNAGDDLDEITDADFNTGLLVFPSKVDYMVMTDSYSVVLS